MFIMSLELLTVKRYVRFIIGNGRFFFCIRLFSYWIIFYWVLGIVRYVRRCRDLENVVYDVFKEMIV